MSLWKNKPLVITLILLIILFVLVFATSDAQSTQSSVVGGLIAPLQGTIYDITVSVEDFFTRIFSPTNLTLENQLLKEQVAQLESELRNMEYVNDENERLKELLNIKDEIGDAPIVTAQVIGNNIGDWNKEFTINVGSAQGVQKDMVVLTDKGLVGRILSVSDTYATVLTIVDSQSGVPALIDRTRDQGVVNGTGAVGWDEDRMLVMDYIPATADVIPGDEIITSNQGGIYPKGLYIGEVVEVGAATGTDERTVYVQSGVDFERLEEVVVMLADYEEEGANP